MKKSPLTIRPLEARDRAAWDGMWAGYLAFYKTDLWPEVSDDTFQRILSGVLIGIVAVDEDGRSSALPMRCSTRAHGARNFSAISKIFMCAKRRAVAASAVR